ncbi:hypothetical protein KY289_013664 [Solanum tuberosum]|nr:hypothetical protein KY289_013664 [Solanum tuberosum]
MVWRLISANWYSVLINGQSHGFFHSTRGLKQGDPLSPTLFIIVAEVLSRSLNQLNEQESFKGFGMPKWSPKINHLAYADDTILFGSGDRHSVIQMMKVAKADWNQACKRKTLGCMVGDVLSKEGMRGASHAWRNMLRVREDVEHEIWWQQKEGTASFWMDNWTKQGALYYIEPQGVYEEMEVKEMILNGQWNIARLRQLLSHDMVDCILENISPTMNMDDQDKAWWMGNAQGEFTIKSAFQLTRKKREEKEWMNNIWLKGLPLKISFFFWRVWRQRIPTDDVLKRMRVNVVSKCHCCNVGEEETIQHLFLTAPIAQKLWKHFALCAGISLEGVHLQQLITIWWDWPGQHKVKQIFKTIPPIIMWELWKRRNARKHGKEVSYSRLLGQCLHTVQMLLKVMYPRLVYWEKPIPEWVKCNTDGACRGNPGQSSYGFSIRNNMGDLIYAEA